MTTWTRLQLDTKDLKVFGFVLALALFIYVWTGNPLIALNGMVSFIFTFIPARLERLKK